MCHAIYACHFLYVDEEVRVLVFCAPCLELLADRVPHDTLVDRYHQYGRTCQCNMLLRKAMSFISHFDSLRMKLLKGACRAVRRTSHPTSLVADNVHHIGSHAPLEVATNGSFYHDDHDGAIAVRLVSSPCRESARLIPYGSPYGTYLRARSRRGREVLGTPNINFCEDDNVFLDSAWAASAICIKSPLLPMLLRQVTKQRPVLPVPAPLDRTACSQLRSSSFPCCQHPWPQLFSVGHQMCPLGAS